MAKSGGHPKWDTQKIPIATIQQYNAGNALKLAETIQLIVISFPIQNQFSEKIESRTKTRCR